MKNSLTLRVLPECYDVVQLAPRTTVDMKEWKGSELLAIIQTAEETTVVCKEGMIEGKRVEGGWRALKIAGTLDFGLVGILSSLLDILAEAEVSVYALSTYSTDIILVKKDRLQIAVDSLKKAGHQIIE